MIGLCGAILDYSRMIDVKNPINCRVLYIRGGAGFLPSTVLLDMMKHIFWMTSFKRQREREREREKKN